jgi:hypothetical protein
VAVIDLDALEAAVAEGEKKNFFVAPIVKELIAELKVAAALRRELNDLFGWGDESMLHASLHVRNAVLNRIVDQRIKERAAVVAWLRRGDECCAANADRIERGEHRREGEP